MATFLDIGLLQKFELIFPFLLVIIVIWGLLSYSKFFGDNKFLHSMIALIFGVLVLFSEPIREIINRMAPWFILMFMFIFFLLVLSEMGGEGSGTYGWMKMTFIILSFVIVIYSIIDVKVWDVDTEDSSDIVAGGDIGKGGKSDVFSTLRHPAVLGLILIFFIATFTIQRLSFET